MLIDILTNLVKSHQCVGLQQGFFFSCEQRKAGPFVRHNCFVAIPPVYVAADMLARPHPRAPALFSPSLLVPRLAAAALWR